MSRIPLVAAVVGALLVGGATTGGTHASWTNARQLQAHGVHAGSMSFTSTSPGAVAVDMTAGSTADSTFVLDDTSVGHNLRQRITASVAGTPAGITARIGTSCATATTASVSVDTSPTSSNQTLCVKVTSSTTAVSGDVTVSISGAQRPIGWATPAATVSVPVTVSSAALALSCGQSVNPSPGYRITWNDVDADFYTVYRSSGANGPWQWAGLTGPNTLHYVEDEWTNGQRSYFVVEAVTDWSVSGTSNVLSVRRSGNSHNFSCGAP